MRPWKRTSSQHRENSGSSQRESATLSTRSAVWEGTSNESIVREWKEYFEYILNPTNTHSNEKAELEDFGLGSSLLLRSLGLSNNS